MRYTGTAYTFTILELAARFVLDVPGIDTLAGICAPSLDPTPGSAQTILAMLDCSDVSFYLDKGKRVAWPPATAYQITLPGAATSQPAHPWGQYLSFDLRG